MIGREGGSVLFPCIDLLLWRELAARALGPVGAVAHLRVLHHVRALVPGPNPESVQILGAVL